MNEVLTEPDTRFASIAVRKSHNSDWDGSIPVGAVMTDRRLGSNLIATTKEHRYVIHPFKGTFHRYRKNIKCRYGHESEAKDWAEPLRNRLRELNQLCRECNQREAKELHHTKPRSVGGDEVLYNLNYITFLCPDCHQKLDNELGVLGRVGDKSIHERNLAMKRMRSEGAKLREIAEEFGLGISLVEKAVNGTDANGKQLRYGKTHMRVLMPVSKSVDGVSK